MNQEQTTLGDRIAERRKAKSLSQKQLAERLRREDGAAITPQYLNDIERNRRVPPDHLIQQIAIELGDDPEFLNLLGGRMTRDMLTQLSRESNFQQFQAFRKKLAE